MSLGPGASVGIVGAGRLGSSLAAAMHGAGYSVAAVSRRQLTDAEAVAERLPGAVATDDAQAVADAADVVFITTSDSAIGPVAEALSLRADQSIVHCSGATPVSALAGPAKQGARTGGFHPLQTFPRPLEGGRFQGITIGVAADDDGLLVWLKGLAETLGGGWIHVPDEARARYHTAATLTSPLVAGLAGMAAGLWMDFGIPRDEALKALTPLLASTASDLGSMTFPDGITGPYMRGDVDVVRAHLAVMHEASVDVSRAYAALALAALPDSAEAGGLSPLQREEIEELLRAHLEARP